MLHYPLVNKKKPFNTKSIQFHHDVFEIPLNLNAHLLPFFTSYVRQLYHSVLNLKFVNDIPLGQGQILTGQYSPT